MRMWSLCVVATLVACSSRAPSAAERQFRAWLDVFNEGDREKLRVFHDESFPLSAREPAITLDQELEFRAKTGGFDIREVEAATATSITVLVQERESDQFARATAEVDSSEPHKVSHFTIRAAPTPEHFLPKRLTEDEAITALRAEIDKRVAADRFAGAVLVAKHGKPIFAQAYGLADRERKLPNTLDTKFRIGFMNKMFTATAIVRLQKDGQLALADTVGKIRPTYPNANVATKVTIQHLLTHTGGTGDIPWSDFDKHRLELKTHDDYLNLYGTSDLKFEPGTRWEYSDYGYVLLGALIESLTHGSYYDYVAAHVFQPAGMKATDSPPEDQPDPLRAVSYMRDVSNARWKSATDILPYRGTAAAGGLSTVKDLLAFANALQAHTLLDAEHTKLLTTAKVRTVFGGWYAFGFSDNTSDGVRCFGHTEGQVGALSICDSGYTIVVLSNVESAAAGRIAKFVQQRLPAK